MDTVANQLCQDVFIFCCGRDHAGVTVVDSGYCIEQMCQVGYACIYGSFRVIVIGIGMGNRVGTQRFGTLYKFYCARQFRRNIHDLYKMIAACLQGFKAL